MFSYNKIISVYIEHLSRSHAFTDYKMDFDYRLKAPFCCIISGPTQSGKSTLTKQIIERRKEIIYPPIDDVIYLYAEDQPKLFSDLREKVSGIQFHKGMPEDFGNDDGMVDNAKHKLIIIDDLLTEMSDSKDAVNLFIRGSHHKRISILFLVQNFFYKNLRTLTLNAKYIILMKNLRSPGCATVLGRQMNCNKRNDVLDLAWKDAMKKQFGYVLIDYEPTQNDEYRIRDSVFPDNMTVYCCK